MLSPEFPYKGNQIILSSERVLLNAKTDGIFLFGKKMVALASTETINLDAKEAILLDSDQVQLGHNAKDLGDPVVLGFKLMSQLNPLVEAMQQLAANLSAVSKTSDADSWLALSEGGRDLYAACNRFLLIVNDVREPNYPLSQVTYSR